jgi:signal transduction histidine kinase
MRRWFRGKPGGLIAFLTIAALVAGGLGWVTAAALRLEREQLEARAETEFQSKLRQALWQLDSVMIAKLSQEASRPFTHFDAVAPPSNPAVDRTGSRTDPGDVVEISPLVNADLPNWILLHFSASPNVRAGERPWWSPQVLSADLQRKLTGIAENPFDPNEYKAELLAELRQLSPDSILAACRSEEKRQVVIRAQVVDEAANMLQKRDDNQLIQQQVGQYLTPQPNNEYTGRASRINIYGQETGKNSKTQAVTNTAWTGPISPNGEYWVRPGLREKSREELVSLGPWNALWIRPEAKRDRLVLARRVSIGKKEVAQGILLNWETLHQDLLAEVADLFPDAKLQPVRVDVAVRDVALREREEERPPEAELRLLPPHPERTMASLPLELEPGVLPAIADPGWSPLRIGLALAWAAALIALAAVGLGGWSLIDLSQRRIRFVSTVTHELRTPLTTLRLYLDMLTGGMVRDDQQKEEYLHTLNAETDRLNRLVGNVLDFSRLENQNPRLEKTPVKINELLERVRDQWQTRCKDAEKDLIVENNLGTVTTFTTDVKLVEQVLGNLIDNACKYSRSAEDRRVWLRAKSEEGRIILEVEDRGPGVARRERRSIFRPFRRGHDADVIAGGVGLGLALSQRWAALLGGRLTVQTGASKIGACFRLELPTA